MASKTNLGGVFLTDLDNQITSNVIASTENVGGIIFDTALVGGISTALQNSAAAATAFANGNVVELNTIDDLKESGLDDTVLFGLPRKHLNDFFALTGNGNRIFVSFMDSTNDPDFEAVEKMQVAAGGIIDHIGVWTTKPIATEGTTYEKVNDPTGNPSTLGYYKKNGDNYVAATETTVTANTDYYIQTVTYEVQPSGVLSKLETQAEILGGKIGVTNFDGNAPVVILVNAPIVNQAECDYRKLPDLTAFEYPKVAMLIGQGADQETHDLQLKLVNQSTPVYAVVGNIGAALACLAVAPANESMAHVANFNLSTAISSAELGFGNLTVSGNAFAAASYSPTNINTLSYQKRNRYLHQKGFVFLTTYDGLENAVFFSSDQTITKGDYSKVALNRVMNKSRRVVRRALLPYVNEDWEVDAATGELSQTAISIVQDIVLGALNANMVEPGTTEPQVSYKACDIASGQQVLMNDALNVSYSLTPRGYTGIFNVTESFALSNS